MASFGRQRKNSELQRMSPKEVNQVHEMTQWKQRVEGEMKSAQEWEDNWSFLVKKDTRQSSEGGQPTGGGESSLNPIKSIGDATANDLERCKRLPPKAKYFRPLTTQQELGWRPPIELFGTDLGHNIQRNDELWAD